MSGNVSLGILILLPIIGGLLTYAVCAGIGGRSPKAARNTELGALTGIVLTTFALCLWIWIREASGEVISLTVNNVCGRGMSFTVDGFRGLYCTVTAFAWLVSTVAFFWYGNGEEHTARYQLFAMITLGCTLGVMLSADLYTTFLFFEGMSMASYVWVAQEETEEAIRASKTYLAVAVIGGLVMLMGIFLLYHLTGTLVIEDLPYQCGFVQNRKLLYVAAGCLFFGFGAKAGCFPLHIWLPKAHPVAPAPASSLLSGILTKAGVFGILILSGRVLASDTAWGEVVLFLGVITMLIGALIALFSIDMKHILACSSVSQIGFILIGAGAMCVMRGENGMAVAGSILHMLNHSGFKLILFLLAGVVVKNLESRDLNVIRGFGRNKTWFLILFLAAALGIAGVPGLSGYVSKTLLHESIVSCYAVTGLTRYKVAEWLFLIAGGCTAAYMTKLFVVLFVREPSEEVIQKEGKPYMPTVLKVLLSVVALGILVGGCLPEITLFPIAGQAGSLAVYEVFDGEIELFGWECLKGGLISLSIGAVLFLFAVRPLVSQKRLPITETPVYVNRWPKWLDLENMIYRPVLLTALPTVFGGCMRGLELFVEAFGKAVLKTFKSVLALLDKVVDATVILMRRTVLHPVCEARNVTIGEAVCNGIGHVGNGFRHLWNASFGKKNPKDGDCVGAVNRAREDLTESVKMVSRSLSYGLIAFCLGLVILLLYILWTLW